MKTNEKIAEIFDEIAELLEIQDANPFRVRAYRNAARTIAGLGKEVTELISEGHPLEELPGIGKDLAGKINEICATGTTRTLLKLQKQVPPSLEELLHIPNLGPKRVRALYTTLGIENISQLERAVRDGRLQQLRGFGEKIENQILNAIVTHRKKKLRHPRTSVLPVVKSVLDYLRRTKDAQQVEVAGSYRRGKELIGDLDILVTATNASAVIAHFVAYENVLRIISQGVTRAAVTLNTGLQVDLRVVDERNFGAALHYFTGSKAHNIRIRRLGQQRGLKINEYGVFRGNRRIAGGTEKSVYRALGLPYISPELREGRGEIDVARERRLPHLIEFSDLQGDLHAHTNATDGSTDVLSMAKAAKNRRLKYIAITDHTKHLAVAHGLDEKRLRRQLDEIDNINTQIKDIRILKGLEVDILEDGRLDMPDHILSKLDLVIGAVHNHFHLSREKQTERILRAMDHRHFSMLAHPSGRLLTERDPYEVDMARVIEQARARGCFLELNSQPQRLDLNENYCRLARDEGVLISINSDAHSPKHFDYLEYGVVQARRGWLSKKNVLNTRPLRDLLQLLKSTMQ